MTRLLRIALPLAVSAVAVVGCGGSSSTPHVAAASSPPAHANTSGHSTASPGVTQLIHTAAQCIRDHGVPNFPDPVVDAHGDIQYDQQIINNLPAAVTQTVQQACKTQITAAESAAQSAADAAQPAATPQEIQQATRFAQCMRQHGWPNFPDPDAHGGFSPANPNDAPTSKSDPAFQACRALMTPRAS
jgi:hypothetical protein